MPLDIAAFTPILKENYEGPIRSWLNNSTYFLSKVKRNTTEFVGLDARIPANTGRNVGVGPRPENTALPNPGAQQYQVLLYTTKYLYGVGRLTGPVLESSKNNVGAFARALQSEMQGLAKDCDQMRSRMIFADGSGMLTLCTAGSTYSAPLTTVYCNSTKYIQVGMQIDLRVKTTGVTIVGGSPCTVMGITDATKFTVQPGTPADISAAIITTTGVYRTGARPTWTTASDMWGLETLVNSDNPGGTSTPNGITETIGGLTRTGHPEWQATVMANGGTLRDLTLSLMQQAFDNADIAIGRTPGLMVTNHATMRSYANLLLPDRRFSGDLQTFDGGFKGLSYNGVPLMADKDCCTTENPAVANRIYFLDLDAFELHMLKDWGFMDRDGNVLQRAVGTTAAVTGAWTYAGLVDAYEFAYNSYQQLGIDNAKGLVVLKDLKES